MATPVLPYPDMDFTPLDILTAAEMDQMVANDQYLRDFCAGLADGTNLSDGVIQARKINWPSLSENHAIWTATSSIVISSSPYTITQLETPKQGKYAFQGVVGGTSTSDTDYAMITVLKNNNNIFQAVSSIVARGNTPRYDVPFYTICDCSAGDLVKFDLAAPIGSAIRAGTSISATLLY